MPVFSSGVLYNWILKPWYLVLLLFVVSRCWMKDNDKALLAHYVINLTVLVIVVVSGLVMLFLVYQKIRNRAEWKQKRMAFLSMWGLSCLYGTTWGLIFLSSGHLSAFFIFIFCFLNSFQGRCLKNIVSVKYVSFILCQFGTKSSHDT